MSKRYQGGVLGVGFNPLQAPNAPTIGTATGGNTSASVPFTAPANVGGSAITGYTGRSSPGAVAATASASPLTFSGLTNGTSYTFNVWALNSYGPSPASGASNSVTPALPYWIGLLSSAAGDTGYSVALDSSGNVYVGGSSIVTGTNEFQIAKYDTSGAIQWQRRFGGGAQEVALSIAVDSSGNVYAFGYSNNSGLYDFQIAKFDTSGAIQWQRRLGAADNSFGYSVAVDSSGNVYVGGQSIISGVNDIYIAKYNTSGTIQWQRSLGGGGTDEGSPFVAVDSSGNVYVCGYSNASGTYDVQIAKYDTSGAIQWQRRLGGSNFDLGTGVAVDSSGNVYVCGYSDSSGSSQFIIAKYDTSGAIQWQRKLNSPSGGGNQANSIAVDSSGDVYVCGRSRGVNADFQIAKYSTSGAIQWQRRFVTSADDIGRGITVDASGSIYVCGSTGVSGTSDFFFAKLPSDGSKTGTYTVGGYSFVYEASDLEEGATSFTSATSSLTSATSSLTDAATSLTSAASSLTSSVTTI